MCVSTARRVFAALVLFHLAQSIYALSLTTFQPINGFSAACTTAYNTELTDCVDSDFTGQGCSKKCIGFLDSLTQTLNNDCAGTSSYPNTLIGMFFNGTGVHTLCPNAGVLSFSSGGGNAYGQGGGQSGSPATPSAATEASASTSSTSTSSTSTSSSSTSTSTSTSSSSYSTSTSTSFSSSYSYSTSSTSSVSSTLQAAATTSTTIVVQTTVAPESTTTSVAVVETTVVPESPSDTSTSTSSTKSSTSSAGTSTSTSNGNGGGTPLDVGSSACHGAAVSVWLFALLAGLAGLVWIL